MARIAYVDHSYHKKTLSTFFLVEILRKHGHVVDLFWDEVWAHGQAVAFDKVCDYDVIIMFQCQCATKNVYYQKLHPNVIQIPMLDQFRLYLGPHSNCVNYWELFQGCKVISFSSAVHSIATAMGIRSFASHYYQPPVEYGKHVSTPLNSLRGFFWLRHDEHVSWPMIRALIGNTVFDRLHLHLAHDPGSPVPVLPTVEEMQHYHITTSTWFEHKEEFTSILKQANVFFAPRREEGIGQAFLEAMARGQCVVAPNHGTMNEYIVHGVNGLLFDPTDPTPLDFSNTSQLGRMAHQSVVAGYARWLEQEQKLVDFILTPSATLYRGFYQHLSLLEPCSMQYGQAVLRKLRKWIRQSWPVRKTETCWLHLWHCIEQQFLKK